MLPEKIEIDDIYKADKTISTISTSNTDAGLNQHSISTGVSTNENLKDSLLAQSLSEELKNKLTLDEVSGEWYRCLPTGIWNPISEIGARKIIDTKLHSYIPNGFTMAKLNNIESFLKLYLSLNHWETDKVLLPMQNGVLNTKTMQLVPYSSDHKFRWQLPYNFNPDAKINIIMEWLNEVTSNDQQLINIIRAFFKITLVGGQIQKFLEVVGPGGTGKSTLVRLLTMLVGEANCVATDLKNLEDNRFEAAGLYGKRLVIVSDSKRYGGEVSVLKAITGGDPVRYEQKNKQQGESFVYHGTVVIASNDPVQSSDYSSGLARRRLPIPFLRKVTDEDKAKWRLYGGIENALKDELPGLLNWVLDMSDEMVNDCVKSISGKMTKAERRHYLATNKIAAWMDDCLVVKENHILHVGSKDESYINEKLYANYHDWCMQNGLETMAVQRFTGHLLDVASYCNLPVKELNRDKRGARISGLKIRSNDDDSIPTPITEDLLSADECRIGADGHTLQTRASVNGADDVDQKQVHDMEVF